MNEDSKKTFVWLCRCEYWKHEEDGEYAMAIIDTETGEVCCVECSAPLEIRTNSTKEIAQ